MNINASNERSESEAPESLAWLTSTSATVPDPEDPEAQLTCRTKSSLPITPDILVANPLLVIDGQTLEVDFVLNANHRFVPGSAPATCPGSPDDVVALLSISQNLFEVDFPSKAELAAQNLIRARLKFARFGVPIVLAFRLKYREGPAVPRAAKKVVGLATIQPGSRIVTLTKR